MPAVMVIVFDLSLHPPALSSTLSTGAQPREEQLYNLSAVPTSHTKHSHVNALHYFLKVNCCLQDGSDPDGTKSPWPCSMAKQMVRRGHIIIIIFLNQLSQLVNPIATNVCQCLNHQFFFPKSHIFSGRLK